MLPCVDVHLPDETTHTVVARRTSVAAPSAFPEFLLIGKTPEDFLTPGPGEDASQLVERIGAMMWGMAERANAMGYSLRHALDEDIFLKQSLI